MHVLRLFRPTYNLGCQTCKHKTAQPSGGSNRISAPRKNLRKAAVFCSVVRCFSISISEKMGSGYRCFLPWVYADVDPRWVTSWISSLSLQDGKTHSRFDVADAASVADYGRIIFTGGSGIERFGHHAVRVQKRHFGCCIYFSLFDCWLPIWPGLFLRMTKQLSLRRSRHLARSL